MSSRIPYIKATSVEETDGEAVATEGTSVTSVAKGKKPTRKKAARKKGDAGMGSAASVAPDEDDDKDSDDDEASDDEGASDGDEDAELCAKAGEKAAARKNSENKMFSCLFEHLTEEREGQRNRR